MDALFSDQPVAPSKNYHRKKSSLYKVHSQKFHFVSELAQCVSEVVTFGYRSCENLKIRGTGLIQNGRTLAYLFVLNQTSNGS